MLSVRTTAGTTGFPEPTRAVGAQRLSLLPATPQRFQQPSISQRSPAAAATVVGERACGPTRNSQGDPQRDGVQERVRTLVLMPQSLGSRDQLPQR
jgi:hypothetical protein